MITHDHDILLFAGLRQGFGGASIRVSLPARARVAELLEHLQSRAPAQAQLLGICRVAVNHEFVTADFVLEPGQEIALIPPVSGGHSGEQPPPPSVPDAIHLTHGPLELEQALHHVRHVDAGGLTTFIGTVRRRSRGRAVDHLEYEAYEPMALGVMAAIRMRVQAEVSGARLAIFHRLGRLELGDTAVIVAASAPHRAQAFMACRLAIEALKRDVPIWKREVGPTGDEWIGRGP